MQRKDARTGSLPGDRDTHKKLGHQAIASIKGKERTLPTEGTAKSALTMGKEEEANSLALEMAHPHHCACEFCGLNSQYQHSTLKSERNQLKQVGSAPQCLAGESANHLRKKTCTQATAKVKLHSQFKDAKVWKIHHLKLVKYGRQVSQ